MWNVPLSRRIFLKGSALLASGFLPGFNQDRLSGRSSLLRTGKNGMRLIPGNQIFTVSDTEGIYHHCGGVVHTPEGLICIYRTSNEHIASWVNINMARSTDGGRTWRDHRVLAESSYEKDKANYVAPITSQVINNKLYVITDLGQKKSPFDWPMLSQWQMPDRGMSNHLLESTDWGKTWLPIRKIDAIGGEPSCIIRLSNGTLMYTRTDSAPTTAKKVPSMPWGPNYYKATAVFSDDSGKTFHRTIPIFDDPLIGDCEVGIVEYAPGKIFALSRIGDAGSGMGQPSRIAYSEDFGNTWSKPALAPVYAHRPYLGKLNNGKVFATFRNSGVGTTATLGWAFEAAESFTYQPNNFIWEEQRCMLEHDGMHLRTEDGTPGAVEFTLYPMEDDDSSCEVEAILAVKDANTYGCCICVGAWVRFAPNRVSIFDRPEQGFDIDATDFHTYRLVNEGHHLKIYTDGTLKLNVPTEGIFTRTVKFGNHRGGKLNDNVKETTGLKPARSLYGLNRSHSIWKSFGINVKNRRDHSVKWEWTARSGKYPDQFRRDNLIMLERNASFSPANSGYSGWTQQPDENIVIADYTCTEKAFAVPILRAYQLTMKDLQK